ncbi:MAG: type II toxin-antitoxin system HicB family antitoxin [Acidobacteriaceae bacterium]
MIETFLVVYAKGESNFSGYAPDILGCVSVGDTLEEMRANMREALEGHLQWMAGDGDPMPTPATTQVDFAPDDFADGVLYYVVERMALEMPASMPRAESASSGERISA